MILLSRNCQHLTELYFSAHDMSKVFGNISSTFVSLKRLELVSDVINGKVDLLKCCPNLTHLYLMTRKGKNLNNFKKYFAFLLIYLFI